MIPWAGVLSARSRVNRAATNGSGTRPVFFPRVRGSIAGGGGWQAWWSVLSARSRVNRWRSSGQARPIRSFRAFAGQSSAVGQWAAASGRAFRSFRAFAGQSPFQEAARPRREFFPRVRGSIGGGVGIMAAHEVLPARSRVNRHDGSAPDCRSFRAFAGKSTRTAPWKSSCQFFPRVRG